jgi:dienelactone hydrolase
MRITGVWVVLLVHLGLVSAVLAEVQTETVSYRDGDVELQGTLAWDAAVEGKRPGVIVVHEWWGLDDYARKRAEMLAKEGYVALAVDMYGKNKVTQHAEEAKGWANQITANVEAWQKRALAGLALLRQDPRTDSSRLAAIGYCFGGATALEMAYSGADLEGVVSFHGSLPPPAENQASNIRAKILIAHGEEDPFIPPERIAAFKTALTKAGADWQFVSYGGARHSFTNPGAAHHGIEGLQYDAKADQRSWRLMLDFFREIFAPQS